MIVVSDTSPLNYLILINHINLLPALVSEIHVPPAVIIELLHPRAPLPVQTWAKSPPAWLRITSPTSPLILPAKFGPGETQAISLAKELAAAVLMDERDATAQAISHGLVVISTLAVLELAATRNLVHLPTALGLLQNTTFRISQALVKTALAADAARRVNNQSN